ncbi:MULTISPECIES: radical SAM family heme chaperone HemW [Robiginitalea]|uniref:radical SAM family heme chaperone HemW n=1 Tax=Robiginitalea TaxID=252306 RepID=UPI00234AB7B6|nr:MULTISPECIES: radical SAM family heme chaperone HemW [unclassified Robiginitalea]MDC6354349.1 radical SAM family heme chaperone HemW [Robiginitalea sp. PM2]MDC6374969.1 radical SAM family heme chaperone HemW [Robiginitalea sp. SP8]
MSGIYLHIPFCKQACHYCDFHFSTTLKHKQGLLEAMELEMEQRRDELGGQPAETLYFGGGTPSLLTGAEIGQLIRRAAACFGLAADAEITLEANPDDLPPGRLEELALSPVNRLSIGIQSFHETELRWMNRAHSAGEALECLEHAAARFANYSIDLIYGISGSRPDDWKRTLEVALGFDPPHISAYALTVEPDTALARFIDKGVTPGVDDHRAREDFSHLVETLQQAGYDHYEISNFGKPGFHSRNNTAYWQGKSYVGIGPSAHSFDGGNRRWNVASNLKYLRAVTEGKTYWEAEQLSTRDRYNEAVMTGLRTQWGVSENRVGSEFGPRYAEYLRQQAAPYLEKGLLASRSGHLVATEAGKFLVDGIASDLFMINLK